MRVPLAAIAISLMIVPAHAQMEGGKGKRHQGTSTKQDTAVRADDNAYKNALKSIPTPHDKPDPWKSVR
jgi:hypothetical protein